MRKLQHLQLPDVAAGSGSPYRNTVPLDFAAFLSVASAGQLCIWHPRLTVSELRPPSVYHCLPSCRNKRISHQPTLSRNSQCSNVVWKERTRPILVNLSLSNKPRCVNRNATTLEWQHFQLPDVAVSSGAPHWARKVLHRTGELLTKQRTVADGGVTSPTQEGKQHAFLPTCLASAIQVSSVQGSKDTTLFRPTVLNTTCNLARSKAVLFDTSVAILRPLSSSQ
jgi:hypothetical protein